ncbi:DNA repair protein RecO [Fundidesulfovibrio magnetotacticus]|uniref:DNA repair protein RecO n=1 Tax=Fundidesulfovibrio magnetotacticus TaxID=2730080 RepID=A0A6V8LTL4_9BACT|nr:DNA repair protein RecO [Fundidesulfovibrio magnetotacticus]GFK95803.1 DNA repair protein RecO [Fundidesulfovibrio magnetotacticus]
MESIEKALVLKVGRFREVDAWLKLFSPRKGVFNAFAFGGSVSRRRFLGCLDPLNVVTFKVKSDAAKGYTYLLEGALVRAHPRLRQDQERLGMAVNCLKFLEAVHLGHPGSEAVYDLTLETLDTLEAGGNPCGLLPLFFRARMAFDQGFRPDFTACARCGVLLDQAPPPSLFLVEQGRLHCSQCRRWGKGAAAILGGEALQALRDLSEHGPARWADMSLPARARGEVARSVDLFVEYHLGLTWDHGSFRRF